MTEKEFRIACLFELHDGVKSDVKNSDIIAYLTGLRECETITQMLAQAVAEKRGIQIVKT